MYINARVYIYIYVYKPKVKGSIGLSEMLNRLRMGRRKGSETMQREY